MVSGPPSTQGLNIQRHSCVFPFHGRNGHPHPSGPLPQTTSRPPPDHLQPAHMSSMSYCFFMSCADKCGFYLFPFLLRVPRSSLSAIRRERSFPDMLQGCKGIVCTNKCLHLSFFRVTPFIFQTTFSVCQDHFQSYSCAPGQCLPV